MKELLKPETLIPHVVHLVVGAAIVVLSAEILHKVHRLGKGVRDIAEGNAEIHKGLREMGRKR